MNNQPDNLSETIKVIHGGHAGKEAHVQKWDWIANNIKARLKKDDPTTTINLRFDQAVFLE